MLPHNESFELALCFARLMRKLFYYKDLIAEQLSCLKLLSEICGLLRFVDCCRTGPAPKCVWIWILFIDE